MFKKLAFVGLAAMSTTLPVSALIQREIDTRIPIKCTFSSTNQNRICVEGARLKKVICPEGYFSFRVEEESGQIFVFALKSFEEEVTLSVITDQGSVQDLEVKAQKKPSEVVILVEPTDLSTLNDQTENELEGSNHILKVIKQSLKGITPEGYARRPTKAEEVRKYTGKTFTLRPCSVLDGPYERVIRFKLINKLKEVIKIEEKDLIMPNDRWVYLDQNEIPPNGEVTVIISRWRHLK